MFATLSAFLPSALQQAPQATRLPDSPTPQPSTPPAPASYPDPPRKKEKKEKPPNEAFIIVRPPPSKSAHPLSLQVQLVPPQSRNDRPVQALDSSPDDLNTDLRRTHSDRSENSAYSNYTSGSVSSISSTSTASSGRRMIIPLYNLNVHSVMPTTILDAGTDAKVAKFTKRGLEVIGLAFLEPIEVRPSPASGSLSARPSLDGSLRELGLTPGRRPVSPARPNTARPPTADDPQKPTINLFLAPPLSPPDMPPQRSSKKLFAKMFKRKDAPQPLSIAVPLPDDIITPQSSPLPNTARLSIEAPVSLPDTPQYPDAWPSTLPNVATSQTAVLGVHSSLYPPVSAPKGRPIKYIWVLRKWLKGTDSGLLNGMMGKLSVGARDANALNTPQIEVRFEWCREDKKSSGRKTRVDKTSNSRTPNTRSTSQTLTPDTRDNRCSIISQASSGSETPSLISSAHQHTEECDEDSDPEDSETPWTCSVAVQRIESSLQQRQTAVREPAVRLKAATLAPTPHHPKVVGLLKMPFPLPDIEVERLVVRRRVVTAQGVSKTTAPNVGEFVLTAEEIKDTVSSTALWLVVREAFGGVGKERKKGKS